MNRDVLFEEDDVFMRLNENDVLVSVETRDAEELNLTGCDVKGIGPESCKDMKNLSRVIIPEGVLEIGMQSFYGCPIEKLELPHSLSTVGSQAFWGIKTDIIQYAGSKSDFLAVIQNSGGDIFGKSVVLNCCDGDLSLDYGK